ncbi:MAG: CgeB family protein [Janthinobacterium lividum]
MRIVYFTHSLRSCWNHGNAHFVRGVLGQLEARGHATLALEPAENWSSENLLRDHGAAGFVPFDRHYPELNSATYRPDDDLDALVGDADVVVVHEWNPPALVAALGRMRRRGARFRLLFHDTHHRAVSDPAAIRAFDLSGYDLVLAFGEALAEVYRGWGWGKRAVVWHEAADTRRFRPPVEPGDRAGLVWIGNWGDGERAAEIETFLLAPARAAGLPLDIFGVRYPAEAQAMAARYGARYHGWVANPDAPALFARHLATVHVPRRHYAATLPGIPTIRMFEALACGIPLVSAPWRDSEGLFTAGDDYLAVADGPAMTRALIAVKNDLGLRAHLATHGLATILARHTCGHRTDELLGHVAALQPHEVPA